MGNHFSNSKYVNIFYTKFYFPYKDEFKYLTLNEMLNHIPTENMDEINKMMFHKQSIQVKSEIINKQDYLTIRIKLFDENIGEVEKLMRNHHAIKRKIFV